MSKGLGRKIVLPLLLIVLLGSVIGIWLTYGRVLDAWPLVTRDSIEEKGQFGDMFGALNALFAGLAFAGIIYALILQIHEQSATREQGLLAAVSTIHTQLESEKSRTFRRHILESGLYKLNEALNSASLPHVDTGEVAANELLTKIQTMTENKKGFNEFIRKLNAPIVEHDFPKGPSVLEIFESVLADYDLVAIPYALDVKAVKEIATQYAPVFERTSSHLQCFIEIRRRLMNDPDYKHHYVSLLEKLNVGATKQSVSATLDKE